MYNTTDYLASLNRDRQFLIAKLRQKGVTVSDNAMFTDLVGKIDEIPSGGGGDDDGIYLVPSVAEMNAISNPQTDDICVVYGEILTPIQRTPVGTTVKFPSTVTFDTAITSDKSVYLEDMMNMATIRSTLTSTTCVVAISSMSSSTTVNYTSSDGITYTRTEATETATIPNDNYSQWYATNYDEEASKFILTSSTAFTGIYQYKNSAWSYLDIGITANADSMYINNSAYTSNGIVTGTVNPAEYKKMKITTGLSTSSLPTTIDGVYIKLVPEITYLSNIYQITRNTSFAFTKLDLDSINTTTISGTSDAPTDYRKTDDNGNYVYFYNKELYTGNYVQGTKTLRLTLSDDERFGVGSYTPVEGTHVYIVGKKNISASVADTRFIKINLSDLTKTSLTPPIASNASYPVNGIFYDKDTKKLYAGNSTASAPALYEYDFNTDTWTEDTSKSFGSFNYALFSGRQEKLDADIVAIFGNNTTRFVNITTKTSIGSISSSGYACVLNGKIYAIDSNGAINVFVVNIDKVNNTMTYEKHTLGYTPIRIYSSNAWGFNTYAGNFYKWGGYYASSKTDNNLYQISNLKDLDISTSNNVIVIQVGDAETDPVADIEEFYFKIPVANMILPSKVVGTPATNKINAIGQIYIPNSDKSAWVLAKDYTN